MVQAAIMAAQTINKIVPGISINAIRGIGGGAARDASRHARLERYEAAVDQGSVTAARFMLGQRDECKNDHERDWYDASIKERSAKYPELFASARALGKLHEPDDDATVSQSAIEAELSKAVNNARTAAANAVQNIGAGATTAATNAIAAPGSALKSSLLIPTNVTAIVVVLLLVGGAFLLLKRHR